jgi:hypothetical protein
VFRGVALLVSQSIHAVAHCARLEHVKHALWLASRLLARMTSPYD